MMLNFLTPEVCKCLVVLILVVGCVAMFSMAISKIQNVGFMRIHTPIMDVEMKSERSDSLEHCRQQDSVKYLLQQHEHINEQGDTAAQ